MYDFTTITTLLGRKNQHKPSFSGLLTQALIEVGVLKSAKLKKEKNAISHLPSNNQA